MEGLYYNIKYGCVSSESPSMPASLTRTCSYIEGIVRGYRNALLTSVNYSNLTQCENIDGRPQHPSISGCLTRYRCQAAAVARVRRLPQQPASQSLDVCTRR
jgi:hypothetical protein